MKRLLLLPLLLLLPTAVLAGVGADFTYDDQGRSEFSATGYTLHMDGQPLCSITATEVTVEDGYLAMSCEATIPVGVHAFTLTASLPNGSSPHSNAFSYYHPPPDPGQPNAPVLIRLRIQVEGADYVIE
jgi:hypothetical protein